MHLPRRIGRWSAVAILVGTVIGSGIFRSPAVVADRVPGAFPILGVWLAGGLIVLCGAVSLAELAGTYPETGGIYVYLREGWGRLAAFLFGWAEVVVIRAAALGAIAMTFAEYFARVWAGTTVGAALEGRVQYVAAAAIALTGAFNYVGVRSGVAVQNTLTVIKCGGLGVLILAALVLALPSGLDHFAAGAAVSVSVSQVETAAHFSVGAALIGALWVYDGWADVSFVAGEIEAPERNLPRVLVFGTLAVMVIYLLANVAYLVVLPVDEMRHSPLVAADVAQRLAGPAGVLAIGVVVMLSTLGTLNGSMLTAPRALWAMANDGLLFKAIARVHPVFQTPSNAILLSTVVGVVFVLLRTFEQLADTFVTAILPFYAFAIAGLFRLRRRPGYRPAFRAIGYPVAPLLFIGAVIALFADTLADPAARLPTAAVFTVILAGIPVYYWRMRRAR